MDAITGLAAFAAGAQGAVLSPVVLLLLAGCAAWFVMHVHLEGKKGRKAAVMSFVGARNEWAKAGAAIGAVAVTAIILVLSL